TILEQINRPAERRCPFAKTSIEVTELLCDYWDISTGYTTSTSFQPLLLSFEKIHYITVKAFFRLWNDMEATVDDFPKQQRIKCLLFGDWFPMITPANIPTNQQNLGRRSIYNKKWRFYRLSPNLKFLHYSDFTEKTFMRDGVEELPER
ncbi:9945_t:CDS:2, partial [Cetraspora pellucida]